MKRDSMVFYRSWLDAINRIKRSSDKLKFFLAIVEYGLNGEEIETNNEAIDMFMINVKAQLDKNNEKYKNGKRGGAPKGNKNAKNNQKTTKNNQKTNNDNDNVNGNDNENANDIIKDNEISSGMAPTEGGQPSDDKYEWEE